MAMLTPIFGAKIQTYLLRSIRSHVERMRPLGDFSNIVHLESFLPCNLANPANLFFPGEIRETTVKTFYFLDVPF